MRNFVGGRPRLIILLELSLRADRVFFELRIELLGLFLEDIRHALTTRFVLVWSRDVFLVKYCRFSDGYLQLFVAVAAQDLLDLRFLEIVAGPRDFLLSLGDFIKHRRFLLVWDRHWVIGACFFPVDLRGVLTGIHRQPCPSLHIIDVAGLRPLSSILTAEQDSVMHLVEVITLRRRVT